MKIWVVNPFDQLPNETDVPLRYWILCRMLAEQGHEVIWWSSDVSHLTKSKRATCPPIDGFSVRLINTPLYTKNISFARLRNHKAFGIGFHREAMNGLTSGALQAPDRIVVSLPPLGVAERAFKIRDAVNLRTENPKCEVIVDIMDAWPETFYRAIPNAIPNTIKRILLSTMHKSAKRAYSGSNKISAVGQTYLDLSSRYLKNKPKPPSYLCYHGTDLARFQSITEKPIGNSRTLEVVCLGSMNEGYDLKTVVEVVVRWKNEQTFPAKIHFAGCGSQEASLKTFCVRHGLLKDPARVIFHGQLNKEAVNKLLLRADLGLVTNKPSTNVACPYKAAEYAAAGLPILSCLGGELGYLLREQNAGSEYKEGDMESLQAAFENYFCNLNILNRHSANARKMAEALFDREQTYPRYADFICSNHSN
jgi:glycosyltransferase involved in cell wall biosynthesis